MALNIRDMDKIAEGRAVGLLEGRAEGIRGAVQIYRDEMHLSDEEIKVRLIKVYGISDSEAAMYLKAN